MKKELSYVDQIVSYIKKNTQKGYDKESLRWALVKQGYSKMEVEKAFKQVEKEDLIMASRNALNKPESVAAIQPVPEEPKKSFWNKFFGL